MEMNFWTLWVTVVVLSVCVSLCVVAVGDGYKLRIDLLDTTPDALNNAAHALRICAELHAAIEAHGSVTVCGINLQDGWWGFASEDTDVVHLYSHGNSTGALRLDKPRVQVRAEQLQLLDNRTENETEDE